MKPNGRLKKGNQSGMATRFVPGQSGNPAGRPIGSKRVSTVIKEMLEKIAPQEVLDVEAIKELCPKKPTLADVIAARLLLESAKGQPWAIKETLDRVEGKPTQTIDVDMAVTDWRELAASGGVSESEVFEQAKQLIEQSDLG